jgi:hypothetical protein
LIPANPPLLAAKARVPPAARGRSARYHLRWGFR